MRAVPIIDLASADTPALGLAVDKACREIGFLVIRGHGVPTAVLERALAAGKAFFALDAAAKSRWTHPDGHSRGYIALGNQGLAYSRGGETPPDLMERYRIGPFGRPDDSYHRARSSTWFRPNLWASEPPDFEAALKAYYAAMEALAARLMSLFAVALGLPAAFFSDRIDRHISSLVVNFYPPQTRAPLEGQLRAGAHTDYGSLTIVAPTAAPAGLQVLDRAGDWREVDPPPGTFVVNLGDLMAQWTNDRWVSTLHRVANPPRDAAASDRMSLVFFHQPNDDAFIECLPSCRGETPRYAPVTSGEHYATKLRKAFEMKARA